MHLEIRDLPPFVRAEYPFASHRIMVDGGKSLHYVDEGQGEPVVFVHGNPTWSFLWRRFITATRDAGFRAIAPDHVGCGLSDKPLDPGYYTAERHVANFGQLVDALGLEKITLVVHDWGGTIGLAWAGRNPDRVKRLVLFNTLVFTPKKRRALSPFHAVFGSAAGSLVARRLRLLVPLAMTFGTSRRLPFDVLRAYLFPFPTVGSQTGVLRFVQLVPDGPDHPTSLLLRETEANYGKLAGKPAIVLWGDDDPVFPKKFAEKWRTALPGLQQLEHFPHASHFLQEDAPDALVPAFVNFLRRQ